MRITIDTDVLKEHQLSIEEFLLLYLNSRGVSIKDTVENILAKGLADKDLFYEGNLVVSDNIKKLLSTVIVDSDSKVVDRDSEFMELAKELRELYPKGKKEGTTYMWRGTVTDIAHKLKVLVVKYNYKFTKEQAIKATKAYIDSFNGQYTKMRLLKYFILKKDRDTGDTVSDFMELIENEDSLDAISKDQDWTSKLV